MKTAFLLFLSFLAVNAAHAEALDPNKPLLCAAPNAPEGAEGMPFMLLGKDRFGPHVQFETDSRFSLNAAEVSTEGNEVTINYGVAPNGHDQSDPRFQETILLDIEKASAKRMSDFTRKVIVIYTECKNFDRAETLADFKKMYAWMKSLK